MRRCFVKDDINWSSILLAFVRAYGRKDADRCNFFSSLCSRTLTVVFLLFVWKSLSDLVLLGDFASLLLDVTQKSCDTQKYLHLRNDEGPPPAHDSLGNFHREYYRCISFTHKKPVQFSGTNRSQSRICKNPAVAAAYQLSFPYCPPPPPTTMIPFIVIAGENNCSSASSSWSSSLTRLLHTHHHHHQDYYCSFYTAGSVCWLLLLLQWQWSSVLRWPHYVQHTSIGLFSAKKQNAKKSNKRRLFMCDAGNFTTPRGYWHM